LTLRIQTTPSAFIERNGYPSKINESARQRAGVGSRIIRVAVGVFKLRRAVEERAADLS
jgi:hypothetical protein